jgi:hypothetical protein
LRNMDTSGHRRAMQGKFRYRILPLVRRGYTSIYVSYQRSLKRETFALKKYLNLLNFR